MKKICISLFFVFTVGFYNAQTYHKFLNNSSWYESSNPGFGMPINYFYYNQSTDTTLNGITYAKILITGSGVIFFAREDSVVKKVYVRDSTNAPEVVLYDFGLSLGDTFFVKVGCRGGNMLKVIGIDSVNSLQGYRKRWSLNDSAGNYFMAPIEGIGNSADPFLKDYCGGDPDYRLVCSYQNQVQLYDCGCGMQCYPYSSQPCDASFTYTNGPNGQVTVTNNTPVLFANWHFAYWNGSANTSYDTSLISTSSLSHTFDCNGYVFASCQASTSTGATCTSTQTISVTNAIGNLHPSFSYTTGCNGEVYLTNTSTGGDTTASYAWHYCYVQQGGCGGNSNLISPSYTLWANHYCAITIQMTNNNGCYSTNNYTDTIYTSCVVSIDGIKNINSGINIFPNPSNGTFTLHYAVQENTTAEIMDISSKLVGKYTLVASENKAEIKN